MLSDTSRSSRKGSSFVLGFHATAERALERWCPVEKKKGKCVAFNTQCVLRKELANEMEKRIRLKAEALYVLQCELTEEEREAHVEEELEEIAIETGGGRTPKQSCAVSSFDCAPRNREYVVKELILQLKREPEYKHWSLDAAVAEEMGLRGVRPCPYSHRGGSESGERGGMGTLSAAFDTKTASPTWSLSSLFPFSSDCRSSGLRLPTSPCRGKEWDLRRRWLFSQLSPLQKNIVCLLWQQCCVVPLFVVCDDVRALLCQALRQQLWERAIAAHHSRPLVLEHQTSGKAVERHPHTVRTPEKTIHKGKGASNGNGGSASAAAGSASFPSELLYTKAKRRRKRSEIGKETWPRSWDRTAVEKAVEEQFERYVNTPTFEERVKEASTSSSVLTVHWTSHPLPIGQWNLSFLPSLLCYISQLPRPHAPSTVKKHCPPASLAQTVYLCSSSPFFPSSFFPLEMEEESDSASPNLRPPQQQVEKEGEEGEAMRHHRKNTEKKNEKKEGAPASLPCFPPPVILPWTRYYFEGLPPSSSCCAVEEGKEKKAAAEEEEERVIGMPMATLHAQYPPLLSAKLTEKEVELSSPAHAEAVLQCLQWLLFVYHEEYRCRPPHAMEAVARFARKQEVKTEEKQEEEEAKEEKKVVPASSCSLASSASTPHSPTVESHRSSLIGERGACWPSEWKHTTEELNQPRKSKMEKNDRTGGNSSWHREKSARDDGVSSEECCASSLLLLRRRELYDQLRYGVAITEGVFHAAFPLDATKPKDRTDKKEAIAIRGRMWKTLSEEKNTRAESLRSGPAWLPSSVGGSSRGTPIQVRELILQHCGITTAESLLSALMHRRSICGSHWNHRLSSSLLSLDLSHNRLLSLRFLYVIRQQQEGEAGLSTVSSSLSETVDGLPRLIRLSLHHNAITQKPDYAEQVRCCLPRLMVLDGKKIRRPPLLLPFPVSSSFTTFIEPSSPRCFAEKEIPSTFSSSLTVEEGAMVMDYLQRFMYIWETKRLPLTEKEEEEEQRKERRARQGGPRHAERTKERRDRGTRGLHESLEEEAGEGKGKMGTTKRRTSGGVAASRPPLFTLPPLEERLDEENFPFRYLHADCVFSFHFSPELTWLDSRKLKLDRQVEMEQTDKKEKVRKRKMLLEEKQQKRKQRAIRREKTLKRKEQDDDNDSEEEGEKESDEKEEEDPGVVSSSATSMGMNKKGNQRTEVVVPLNAQDYRELQLFFVSLKNSSRNLLRGRQSLEQLARGASHCYLAYISTVYPERVQVQHHWGGPTIVSWMRIGGRSSSRVSSTGEEVKGKGKKRENDHEEGVGSEKEEDVHYMVQLHGIMTWSLPSMLPHLPFLPPGHVLTAAFDRTMVLVPRQLPRYGRFLEETKGHRLVLKNDLLHLRPVPPAPCSTSSGAAVSTLSVPLSPCVGLAQQLSLARLLPYVLAWGLDTQEADGFRVVREVAEQSGSEAALHAALDILVFRLTSEPPRHTVEQHADEKWTEEHEQKQKKRKKEGVGVEKVEAEREGRGTAPTAPGGSGTSGVPLLFWREESAEEEQRREEEENEFLQETLAQRDRRRARASAVRVAVCERLAEERKRLTCCGTSSTSLAPLDSTTPSSSCIFSASPSSSCSQWTVRILSSFHPNRQRHTRVWNPWTTSSDEGRRLALPSFDAIFPHAPRSTEVEEAHSPHPSHNTDRDAWGQSEGTPILVSLPLLHDVVRIVNQYYVV